VGVASEGPKTDPRWRVVILDDHERSRAALRAAIWAAGGEVVGEAVRCADALGLVRRTSPDVAVCAVGLPDGDGIEMARQLIDAGCPVVLFTSHTRQELVDQARAAGVMAYLLKPLRSAELAPVLDLAIARFNETRDLRRSLEERKIIERAKGRLMARYQLTEDDAFRRLRRAAMDSRRPMVDIARALLVSESVASDVPTH
jgi:response regulator NasT